MKLFVVTIFRTVKKCTQISGIFCYFSFLLSPNLKNLSSYDCCNTRYLVTFHNQKIQKNISIQFSPFIFICNFTFNSPLAFCLLRLCRQNQISFTHFNYTPCSWNVFFTFNDYLIVLADDSKNLLNDFFPFNVF